MIRTSVLTLAATASIGLAGASTATASGSHWSRAKCTSAYTSWYDKHFNPSQALTPSEVRQVKAYIKALEKKHHCKVGA